jgi:TIR domain
MPVFISWSGDRSRHVASALASFLEAAIPRAPAWMSQQHLDVGHPWQDTLRKVLNTSHYGILCLTPENLSAPWLLFEAGAISKNLETARVVPYLLNVKGTDLAPPLSLFQGVSADEDGTWRLLTSVASTLPERLDEAELRSAFDAHWPACRDRIAPISDAQSAASERELQRARERMEAFGSRVQGAWFERIPGDGIGLFNICEDVGHNSVRVDDGNFFSENGDFVAHFRSAVARLDEQHGREGIVYLRECHRDDRDHGTWFHGYGDMWFEGRDDAAFNRGRGTFYDGDLQDRRKLVAKSVTLRRLNDPAEIRIVEHGTDTERQSLAKAVLQRSL